VSGLLVALGVALGGAVGATLRLLVDTWVGARTRPGRGWGIVVVNVTGSFAIGVVVGAVPTGDARTVLATGLLGGYTTFSTASLDSARLALRGRGGAAVLHAAGTAAACVLAAWLGTLV
jgi:CrcB protein